ncbi:MAG: uroporphyrinogen-III C-methyltransferase [Deltaproteobacteria bacterium]
MKGIVYLVGVGPGDPGLITIKAIEKIKGSDVLVYDYLANKKFLEYAKDGAEVIYVGKRGGCHTLPQDEINDVLIQKVREGKVVARVKGGDPFIFGRGGEEAEALAEAGIPFEVVPGVTAGIAVPAYAGIPITHRDFTTTATFITGHENPTKADSNLYWDRIATGVGTIVFFMGMANLEQNMKKLMDNGRDPKTPVALIRWGTTPEQETLVGTVEDIAEKVKTSNFKPPAVAVVGGVVSLREKLRWFDTRPLFGKRIVVTRAREQASDFAEILEREGACVVEFPTIRIVPPASWDAIDSAIERLGSYHWAIFTSVNGVKYFIERLKATGRDVRALKGIKLCAIGPKTASDIEELGLRLDFVPKEYRAEGILEGLGDVKGMRILIPRAEVAREILPDELVRMGAVVDVVTAYKTVRPEGKREDIMDLFNQGKIDAVTFASSSTVTNFLQMFDEGVGIKFLKDVKVASIGPITAETASKHGIKTAIMPKNYTIPALAEAIVDYYRGENL